MDGSGFAGMARVAVLVDGDNVPARHQAAVMAEAARLGRIDVRRVYGDAARCAGWDGFRIVHASGAKNAADMWLVVDAMALALSEGIGAFAIASADRDFAPVATALRERGNMVVGLGRERSGLTFQQACVRFVVLDETGPNETGPNETGTPVARPTVEAATRAIEVPGSTRLTPSEANAREVIRATGGEGLELARLAGRLGKVPEGAKTWRAFFESRPALFVCDPKGPLARVRLTPAGAMVR
jgi:hypothetical protein